MIEIRYFAWLRERVGVASESIDPGDAVTAGDLIARLSAQSESHARAFENPAVIRVAIDQEMADLDTPIGTAREVAFFPPVTGG